MNCPYCAEEIKDAAILCRFCGAVKEADDWAPPPSRAGAGVTRKGHFTIRTSGVLFILSALYELLSITSEVPLFGAYRGGATAMLYHLLFIVGFMTIGVGLYKGKRWGSSMVFWGTVVYTLDRILYMLDGKAREAHVLKLLNGSRELMDFIDMNTMDRLMISVAMITMVCWWGFALYIYQRRDYFQPEEKTFQAFHPAKRD